MRAVRPASQTQPPGLSSALLLTMATASGVAVANIYYNQPMLADMARSFGATPHQIGYAATATQIGYALGMPLFVPLGDFVQRRRLVPGLFGATALALALTALSPNLAWLITMSLLVGLTTVIAQILIPFAADLSAPGEQGRTIGSVQSGVLLGILLARTVSGAVAQHFGWRAMYWLAAGCACLFAILLAVRLPYVPRQSTMTYGEFMWSTWRFVLDSKKLRRVCFIAGMFFASFSAFWTTLIFLLQAPPYHYGSQTAGLFGLVGAVGAAAAPISGRLSDRRGPRFVVRIAIGIVLLAFAIFWRFEFRVWGLISGVILLDAGVQSAQVANQSLVLNLFPEARNRINSIYMIGYFGIGALGPFVASWAWTEWNWPGVCSIGMVFMLLAAVALWSDKSKSGAKAADGV